MKGTILKCLHEMVRERYGEAKWDAIVVAAGAPSGTVYFPSQDVPEDVAMRVLASAAPVLRMSTGQVYDAFAAHWVDVYAPKIYRRFYEGATSAREFLLSLDRIHDVVTRSIEGATPPRFTYHWVDARTLRMTYRSERGLLALFEALALALGRHFGEELRTRQIGRDVLEVVFPTEGPTETPR